MKKYIFKDEDGCKLEVEELDEETEVIDEENVDEVVLNKDEIIALKKLAPVVDKLVDLLKVEEKEHEGMTEDEDEEEVEEEITHDEDEEEVIETCTKAHDSKKSFGALEKKQKIDDSADLVDEISNAWAKRYGGNA